MLKGISPLLSPQLLKVLAEMGHGDTLVIGDANFAAASLARDAYAVVAAGETHRYGCVIFQKGIC